MKTELFLIELYCDDLAEWIEVETNSDPWPVPGGEAEEMVAAGCRYRWTLLRSRRGR